MSKIFSWSKSNFVQDFFFWLLFFILCGIPMVTLFFVIEEADPCVFFIYKNL